jgi:ACT domain-containing protein
MTRRILTAEDIGAMQPGTRLVLDESVTLTSPGRELARRRGIELVEDGTAVQAAAAGSEHPQSSPAADSTALDVAAPASAGSPGRIIITAVGVNRPGILSEVTGAIGQLKGDIQDVSQLINAGYFNAVLIVDISGAGQSFGAFRDALRELSKPADYVVTVIDERVFQAMHRL